MNGQGIYRSRSGGGAGLGLGLCLVLALSISAAGPAMAAGFGRAKPDPARIVPLDQIAPEYREPISEVIRDYTFHRQGATEAFPCDSNLYMSLVNEPAITLGLWKDLAESPIRIKRLTADRYIGEDGSGSAATWDFVLRTPNLHVLIAKVSYISPRGNAQIDARIVLLLHTGYYREVNGEPYIQHDIEAFVKVDSKGWKTLARTFRPVIEGVLEDQVKEAGQFISLMSRLVVMYPNWATSVAMRQVEADEKSRLRFREIVAENRRPEASDGRPVVMADRMETADARRR